MDQDSDDEKCDSIYANEETAELMNVSFRLESNSLEDLLKEDQEKIKEREGDKQWYHGRITRDVAEDILRKGKFCKCNFTQFNIVIKLEKMTSQWIKIRP